MRFVYNEIRCGVFYIGRHFDVRILPHYCNFHNIRFNVFVHVKSHAQWLFIVEYFIHVRVLTQWQMTIAIYTYGVCLRLTWTNATTIWIQIQNLATFETFSITSAKYRLYFCGFAFEIPYRNECSMNFIGIFPEKIVLFLDSTKMEHLMPYKFHRFFFSLSLCNSFICTSCRLIIIRMILNEKYIDCIIKWMNIEFLKYEWQIDLNFYEN